MSADSLSNQLPLIILENGRFWDKKTYRTFLGSSA